MAAKRQITRADLLPMAEYGRIRAERRRALRPVKDRRRVAVGPFATFYFESYETMWLQVHEMLFVEQGGEGQIEDELAAYNPLIPQGRELVATVMLEIDDPARRARELLRLGGIEDHIYLELDGARIQATAERDVDRTSAAGKASSVHFVHFPLTDAQADRFKVEGARLLLGIDHPNHGHIAVVPEPVRAELATDLD